MTNHVFFLYNSETKHQSIKWKTSNVFKVKSKHHIHQGIGLLFVYIHEIAHITRLLGA